ncbi:MAG TPA: hypothetical protein DCQ32_00690 [Cyanobacteria bacterium UBA8156]|jgi:Uma2 family endonuclease|nr:hypothetical protein [Cyanobacteria bacterium UBA8156]
MGVTIALDRIEILPGQRLCLHDIDWPQLEAILAELGEKRATRIASYQNTLEIRMPLPEHERLKVILGDLLKILLDHLDMEWESLGSTTYKKRSDRAGIEPDDCFYIRNYRAAVGMKRVDLTQDPPPDLAIEVDLTSKTQIRAYEAIGVPEVWCCDRHQLKIYLLENGQYQASATSATFANIDVTALFSEFLNPDETKPMSERRRDFRQRLQDRYPV